VNIILIVSTIEPVSVLKTEFFSPRPEARVRALLRDLNIEFLSARLEVETSEPLRALMRPLVSDPTKPRDPLRP